MNGSMNKTRPIDDTLLSKVDPPSETQPAASEDVAAALLVCDVLTFHLHHYYSGAVMICTVPQRDVTSDVWTSLLGLSNVISASISSGENIAVQSWWRMMVHTKKSAAATR